jgi:uncharacterized RDD family membrane protein YckC
MNRERYLERALRDAVGPRAKVDRFAADLREHFEAGAERGETDAVVASRLGAPEEVAAAFMAEIELEPAGFWVRLFAFAADLGLLVAMCLPAGAVVALAANAGPRNGALFVAAALAMGLALLGVVVLYFPLFEGRYGRTPGKWWMRLRVLDEARVHASFGQAFLRRLSLYFEILALDALFVPFTRKKQRAFDIVARTIVVHEPDGRVQLWRWLACLAPWLVVGAILAVIRLGQAPTGGS